jgi:transposase
MEVRHEPETTQCTCGCTLTRSGEDVSQKLGHTPSVLTVKRHVLVAKYLRLPLYRQEGIFGRAGLAFPRSTLAQPASRIDEHGGAGLADPACLGKV